ncbi:multidrug transporter [Xenorhabdus kozodoii]|uniref:Multidrug transporter n=1 Tax=Xenorhabdus kozodoii TaxID=351676 RepID=A0A2D0LD48_9GAMM|nr:MFS transporter [Xenorhabdus kozodoii]PHM73624.1 multidrug transporter [Xenorhabdus kozodoii]
MSFFTLAVIYFIGLIIVLYTMRETNTKTQKPSGIFIPYINLVKNTRFIAFSIASSLIFSFTIGYYSISPYVFHQLGYTPVENSFFYLVYSFGIFSGSWLMGRNFIKTPPEKIYFLMLMSYMVILLLFLLSDLNIPITIIALSFLLAIISGASAPLALVLCMEDVTENKGAASALQGALKMSFTGIFMIFFDLFHITSFYPLIHIVIIFTVMLFIIYFFCKHLPQYQ